MQLKYGQALVGVPTQREGEDLLASGLALSWLGRVNKACVTCGGG